MNPSRENHQLNARAFSAAGWRGLAAVLILSIALALSGFAALSAFAEVAAGEAETLPAIGTELLYANPELRLLDHYDDGAKDAHPPSCAASGGVCSPTIIDYWAKGSSIV
jgi:hypothetical protein